MAAGVVFLMGVPTALHAECIRRFVSSEAYAGYSDGEAKALQLAISGWSRNVKAVASVEYSNWDKAQQKTRHCELSSNKKYYKCNLTGVPCR